MTIDQWMSTVSRAFSGCANSFLYIYLVISLLTGENAAGNER